MPARIATAPTLALVVPTYNERDRLPELVRAIFAAYDGAGIDGELVIVDDNSPDGTGARRRRARARPADHASSIAPASSVSAPRWSKASPPPNAEIVGVIDADLSHPPELVPRMLVGHASARGPTS